VNLYSVAPSNAACQGDYTCLAPPRLIAEGLVLADGSVSVLLPAGQSVR
jgi:hypothetical protein